MNNDNILIEERARDIGQFLVGRLLPFRSKRQVGPFTFIDHMGPATVGPGRYVDVDQHPHIGLSTLTYLIEGEIEHKDSTGANQVISSGDVGFMTSGKGVTHTERTPQVLRNGNSHSLHGYQVWVALPKEKEEMEPNFQFIPKAKLPRLSKNGLEITIIAGTGFGHTSPLKVYSPLFMIEIISIHTEQLNIHNQVVGEIAIVVVSGEVEANGETIGQGQMLVSKSENTCDISLKKNTRVLLFGGEPLPEPRYLHWNFVSNSKKRLKQAAEDWKAKRFPKVEGDDTYIPLTF